MLRRTVCATLQASLLHPRPHQAPHDGRGLALGCRGGVGVGGQGEAGVAVAKHGGDSFHVHAVL